MIEAIDKLDRTEIGGKALHVGLRCHLAEACNVLTIVNKSEVLAVTKYSDVRVWVRGIDTEGLTSDSSLKLSGTMEVVGTKDYETTLGAKATVLLIQPAKPLDDLTLTELEAYGETLKKAAERESSR